MDKLFNLYLQELIAWNQKFNLTAITEPEAIRQKHFADSLLLLQVKKLAQERVVDVGTGAGFPGIPLKIVCPGIHLTLLEATRKKVAFLQHLITTLGLTQTEAIWTRAEVFARTQRAVFDLAIARAVADLAVLAGYCLPLVRVGGLFVAYKQVAVEPEVEKATPTITRLGGEVATIKVFPQRSLVLINKVKSTPRKYPRHVL